MKIGVVGLGKVGLAAALAFAHRGGHDVVGYDLQPDRVRARLADPQDHGEQGLGDLIADGPIELVDDVDRLVKHADLIFVAVQTPHDPRYGGEQPMPDETRDFEYGYLVQAVRDVAHAADRAGKDITIVVVSTVLPGTTRTRLAPLCGHHSRIVYSPAFISLGTVLPDLLNPEFVLIGADDPGPAAQVRLALAALHLRDRPVHLCSIESAELLKVSLNVFITMKIVFANWLAEIADGTGADVDQVTAGLNLAGHRMARAGMGDGGACRPRDAIAMSWLAERLGLSADLASGLTFAREQQSARLARLVAGWSEQSGLPICLLGLAYKPSVPYTMGSPARLLEHYLAELGHATLPVYDPHLHGAYAKLPDRPAVFVAATRHPEFLDLALPAGSVLIDPWGYLPDQPGVTTVRPGRKR